VIPPEAHPEPTPWPTQRRFHVAYHDLDALNHLNHATYFVYMETLRCDYYLPLLSHRNPSQLDIIILEATCRYLAPVSYGQILLGEVAPAHPIGRTSFSLLYRFRDQKGVQTARGKTVVVCYDYEKGKKKEIPTERKKILESHAVDPSTEGW
jgi:acyl-CoA thioester hydrolase